MYARVAVSSGRPGDRSTRLTLGGDGYRNRTDAAALEALGPALGALAVRARCPSARALPLDDRRHGRRRRPPGDRLVDRRRDADRDHSCAGEGVRPPWIVSASERPSVREVGAAPARPERRSRRRPSVAHTRGIPRRRPDGKARARSRPAARSGRGAARPGRRAARRAVPPAASRPAPDLGVGERLLELRVLGAARAWRTCAMRTGARALRREERGVQRDVADVAAGDVEPRELRRGRGPRSASRRGRRAARSRARCVGVRERELRRRSGAGAGRPGRARSSGWSSGSPARGRPPSAAAGS